MNYKMIIIFRQDKQAGDLSDLKELIQLMFLQNENAFVRDIQIEQVD